MASVGVIVVEIHLTLSINAENKPLALDWLELNLQYNDPKREVDFC